MIAKGYQSIPGLLAGSDLSSKQYHAVIFASTVGEVVICDLPTNSMAAGILQNDPTDGQAADVAYRGVALGICESTAIAFGSPVCSNSTGELQVCGAVDEVKCLGRALAAGAAVGDIIPVLVSLSWYGTTT